MHARSVDRHLVICTAHPPPFMTGWWQRGDIPSRCSRDIMEGQERRGDAEDSHQNIVTEPTGAVYLCSVCGQRLAPINCVPAVQELLFVSKKAIYKPPKAIR